MDLGLRQSLADDIQRRGRGSAARGCDCVPGPGLRSGCWRSPGRACSGGGVSVRSGQRPRPERQGRDVGKALASAQCPGHTGPSPVGVEQDVAAGSVRVAVRPSESTVQGRAHGPRPRRRAWWHRGAAAASLLSGLLQPWDPGRTQRAPLRLWGKGPKPGEPRPRGPACGGGRPGRGPGFGPDLPSMSPEPLRVGACPGPHPRALASQAA